MATGGIPPNPLTGSLNGSTGMPGLGGLNPAAAQQAQNQTLTAQQQGNAQALAQLLQKQGQSNDGKFTSPWQVAGQMAQALKGRQMMGQANQGAAALNAQAAPAGAAAPMVPGQSPATPGAPGGAPGAPGGWNQPLGTPQGPGAVPMPPPRPPQAPMQTDNLDLENMFG